MPGTGGGSIAGTATYSFTPATGGHTDYTYTATGGATLAGSATSRTARETTASGGLTSSGEALTANTRVYTYDGSGGLETAGDAVLAMAASIIATGSAATGGSASVRASMVVVATGGITLGGTVAPLFGFAFRNPALVSGTADALSLAGAGDAHAVTGTKDRIRHSLTVSARKFNLGTNRIKVDVND